MEVSPETVSSTSTAAGAAARIRVGEIRGCSCVPDSSTTKVCASALGSERSVCVSDCRGRGGGGSNEAVDRRSRERSNSSLRRSRILRIPNRPASSTTMRPRGTYQCSMIQSKIEPPRSSATVLFGWAGVLAGLPASAAGAAFAGAATGLAGGAVGATGAAAGAAWGGVLLTGCASRRCMSASSALRSSTSRRCSASCASS